MRYHRPKASSSDPEERTLAGIVSSLIARHPEFRQWFEVHCPKSTPEEYLLKLLALGRRVTHRDQEYKYFNCIRHIPELRQRYDQAYPKPTPEQQKVNYLTLGRRMTQQDPDYRNFQYHYGADLVFRERFDLMYPRGADVRKERLLRLGRRVRLGDEDYSAFGGYASPNSTTYDPEFMIKYNRLYPPRLNKKEYKEALLGLGFRIGTKHPWWSRLVHYCKDPVFAKQYDELYPSARGFYHANE